MGSALDLLGVVACAGSGITKASLPPAAVSRYRLCCFLFLPGLYLICCDLFKCLQHVCGYKINFGQSGDMLELLGMKSSLKLRYVGLQSGTHKAVANACFEGWINTHASLPRVPTVSAGLRRRPTTVGFVSCSIKHPSDFDRQLKLRGTTVHKFLIHKFLMIFLQVVTWLIWYWIVCTRDLTAIVISSSNMLASFLVFSSITSLSCMLPNPKVAAGAPSGSSVVMDGDNNNMWVVVGDEYDIQTLLQYPIHVQGTHAQKVLQLLAAVFGSCCAASTVLLMPTISPLCQAFLACQLLVGVIATMTMMTQGGDTMLSSLTTQFFSMGNPCRMEFSSRTAAVAAVVMATRGSCCNLSDSFVPVTTEAWINFRKALDLVVQQMQPEWTAAAIEVLLKEEGLVLNTTYASVEELKEAFIAVRAWEARVPGPNKLAIV